MKRAPWEYLVEPFLGRSPDDYLGNGPVSGTPAFPDLGLPLVIVAAVFLVLQVIMYNVQTRRLHRHFPLVNLQEWLLWTGASTFLLVVVSYIFRFYFIFPLTALVLGIATYVWIRFIRFPPLIAAYNQQLRRARCQSQQRSRHPEVTVRPRRQGPARRRRRR
ncbi:hypothetical protein BH18CHL1_BH18CHL1_09840 [soil metagenome]